MLDRHAVASLLRLRVDGMTCENNFKNGHVDGKLLMRFYTKTHTCGRGPNLSTDMRRLKPEATFACFIQPATLHDLDSQINISSP